MATPHLVIPTGTKVLARATGHVGVVIHTPSSPGHNYRVRFPDGHEATFRRSGLAIFKLVQSELPGVPDPTSLYPFVIYAASAIW